MILNLKVKFITSEDSVCLNHNDFKSSRYEGKKKSEETLYNKAKKDYHKRCGVVRKLSQLKQLEEKIREHLIVYSKWQSDNLLTIIFSSGTIAHLTVKSKTLDISQVFLDRYYTARISGQVVANVVVSNKYMLFLHSDKTANLITFGKTSLQLPVHLSDRDPHIQSVELLSGSRRNERKLSWYENNALLWILIWGSSSCEPTPWSPVQEDCANLHLYKVDRKKLLLIAHHQLEKDTLLAEIFDDTIDIIEQTHNQKSGVTLNWSRYDIQKINTSPLKLSTLQPTLGRVSLQTPVCSVHQLPCRKRLFVSCIDSSLYVIHHIAGILHSNRAGFIGSTITCVGELMIVADDGGRLQCFDHALSPLHHHTTCLDLASYLKSPQKFSLLATHAIKGGPALVAKFSGGPLMLLHLQHPRLITTWIRTNQIQNAVSLLRAMDWSIEGPMCLWALQRLCKLVVTHEGLTHVEQALSAYFAPVAPHPPEVDKYAASVHDLARKFFHQLLRRGELDKALSLGVELRGWDLFSDARWLALRRGDTEIARDAANLAAAHAPRDHASECSSSCSQCSSQSDSESDASSATEHKRTIPPPLPRVKLPTPPYIPSNILNVNIDHNQNTQPHFHRYLKRDNIWNIAVGNKEEIGIQNNMMHFEDHNFQINLAPSELKFHNPSEKNINEPKSITMKRNMEKEAWQSVDSQQQSTSKESIQTRNFLTYPQWQHLEQYIANRSTLHRTNEPSTTSNISSISESQSIRYMPKASINITSVYNANANVRISSQNIMEASAMPRVNTEKNKVKFSDTVQIALLSDCHIGTKESQANVSNLHTGIQCTQPSGFGEPYSENRSTGDSEPNVPKIKVVHLGMV